MKRYTAEELKRKPTLAQGQADNLKVDTGKYRVFRLTHDGQPIMEGTEIEIIAYIHKHHSYSLMHAVNHEGYRLDPVVAPMERTP